MLITLIIKGDRFAASKSATRHGVPFAFASTKSGNTVGQTNANEATLSKWLCEPPYQAPFPDGTLLYYKPAKE